MTVTTWGQMESHLEWWNREIADVRIHGTTGEQPLARFQRDEARALLALNGKPSYLAEQEFCRRVAKDCCVQVEGNWYSVPVALVRQNVMVQIRDQQVLIRQGGRIGVPTVSGPTSRPGNGAALVAGTAPERLRGCCGGGGLMPRSTQQTPAPSRSGMTAAEPAEIQRLVEELDGMLNRLRLRAIREQLDGLLEEAAPEDWIEAFLVSHRELRSAEQHQRPGNR